MSKKYKVYKDGNLLGHYYGKCPREAVDKAVNHNKNWINSNGKFIAVKNDVATTVAM